VLSTQCKFGWQKLEELEIVMRLIKTYPECLCECIEDTSESECVSAIRESIESLIILHSSTELHFTGEITF